MAGERSPIPHEKRQAVLKMRKGGASYDEISAALGVSKTWISRFLRRRDEEQAQLAGAPAARASSPPSSPSAEEGEEESSTEDNVSALEEELRQLRVMSTRTHDPLDRAKMSTAIATITSKLASLRREEAKAKPTGNDDVVRRAGYAAADKLRSLVEEALGEKLPPEDEADAP